MRPVLNFKVELIGSPVRLDSASPWNVLAYAVELKGREAELTRQDFRDVVKNFERYGERPVVLYHADTKNDAHPESRKAHAWIVAMRVGSMQRNGQTIATLEGRFRWVEESTKADVQKGALQFGSVTLFQHAIDEETGHDIGSFLYSFSLTNNPALVDLPKLAADQLTGKTKVNSMETFLQLAAQLGVPVSSEDDARAKVQALASEALEVRKALNLSTRAEVASKIGSLAADSAKLVTLTTELESHRAVEEKRKEGERASHIDALCASNASLKGIRASLEFHAKADWEGFAKAYPISLASDPKATALSVENEKLKALLLGTRLAPLAGDTSAPESTPVMPRSHVELARDIAAQLREKNPKLTEHESILLASKQLKNAVSGVVRS
jgi:hypothetical protein